MTDGAHLGIQPERALATILGGEPAPEEDEGMSREEMRAYLEAFDGTIKSYDDCARGLAAWLLTAAQEHPEMLSAPITGTYTWPDGYEMPPVVTVKGWDDLLKEHDADSYKAAMERFGPTGFMWGWSCNAVRYCLELPPAPNPAIITLGEAPS